MKGLRISKWIIDVRNERRRADILPKKPEAVLDVHCSEVTKR